RRRHRRLVSDWSSDVCSSDLDASGEDLLELHVRLRRTASGIDVLLAGTTPSVQGAAAAAEQINLIRDQGMVGLSVLPLVLKTHEIGRASCRERVENAVGADA